MRRMFEAAAGGLGAAFVLALSAQAQPVGYYPHWWSADYAYRYVPVQAYGPHGANTGQPFDNGVDSFNGDAYSASGVRLGAAIVASQAPRDAYGLDPSGMIAPDGHRIECRIVARWDDYYNRAVGRRECR